MLSTHSRDIWKFEDDVSTSEKILKNSETEFQSSLNVINSWASGNFMKLNPKKCKELRVCFLRETPVSSLLLLMVMRLKLCGPIKWWVCLSKMILN